MDQEKTPTVTPTEPADAYVEKTTPEVLAPAPAQPTVSQLEDTSTSRNFLVTFLLAMNFGILGLRNFYLGDKKLGWIRLALLLAYPIVAFLGVATQQGGLVMLGGAAGLVAFGWALVDFFYVYFAVKTDAAGQPLSASARDKKWAKVLFWVTIVVAIIYIALAALLASFAQQNQSYTNQELYNTIESMDSKSTNTEPLFN